MIQSKEGIFFFSANRMDFIDQGAIKQQTERQLKLNIS